MTEYEEYFQYLKQRSLIGLVYRRWWLYPRLVHHLQGKVLDVGCGIGDMLRYRPGTVGTDINPLTVNWLEKQGLKAYQMLPDKLPFNDEFDSILLDNVLEHILEPVPILKEIRRVMKSSGQLLVGVPGELGYRSDPDHKVFYDQDLLVTVLSKVGFQPVKIFFTPFRAEWANRKVRQYCMYGIFKLKKI